MALTFRNNSLSSLSNPEVFSDLGTDIGFNYANQNRVDVGEMAAQDMVNRAELEMAGQRAESDLYQNGAELIGRAAAEAKARKAQEEADKKNQQSSFLQTGLKTAFNVGLAAITLSDESTKFDIKQISSALETLRNLRPVTFHYKEEFSSSPERMHHGFIAQEFQKVLPDATYYDESIGKIAIDTGDIIGLLVRANQELETRIARLEATKALAGVN